MYYLLKSFNEIRMEEWLLILKEFWFVLNEFYPVHPGSMNSSLAISLPEVDFFCVGSS